MADLPLSGLPAATVINPEDLMLITQSAVSKKADADLLRNILFMDPRRGFIEHTEWLRAFADANSYEGETGWYNSVTGAGAVVQAATGNIYNRVHGILHLKTGTTATGEARAYKGPVNLQAGDGLTEFEASAVLDALSDGTNRFEINIGFASAKYGTSPRRGIGFYYRDDVNGGKWLCSVEDTTSGKTEVDSGITVVAGTWYNLEARINAGGTSVAFYIDDALVATITTDIPTGTTKLFANWIDIIKSLGTSAKDLFIDYFQVRKRFTSLR